MAGKDKKQKRKEKSLRRKVKKTPEPEIKQDPDVPKFPRGEAVRVRGSARPATIDAVGSPSVGTAAFLKNFYEDVDMNEYSRKQLKEMERSGVSGMKNGGAVMNGRGPKFKGQS